MNRKKLIFFLTLLGLISHMQYIFRKQCEHLTVRTQELQKKFLKAQIIQVMVPVTLVFIPVIIVYIRLLDGRLGLQILNDILMMMMSSYGSVATFFLIFFNVPYRQFLSEKLKEFARRPRSDTCSSPLKMSTTPQRRTPRWFTTLTAASRTFPFITFTNLFSHYT
uniref:G_PROTEIN_RECEP_F1_2 domain-containing protein n=1 Tax=Heterorhabditis bacteriophora TaxID=37862 RepID=A0A1I7XAZ9_HETBA